MFLKYYILACAAPPHALPVSLFPNDHVLPVEPSDLREFQEYDREIKERLCGATAAFAAVEDKGTFVGMAAFGGLALKLGNPGNLRFDTLFNEAKSGPAW